MDMVTLTLMDALALASIWSAFWHIKEAVGPTKHDNQPCDSFIQEIIGSGQPQSYVAPRQQWFTKLGVMFGGPHPFG